MNLETSSIKVSNRQRRTIETDEHFVESVRKRLLHPIVLRMENDEPHLVVGGRRLEALKKIGLEVLEENTHYRFIHDLSPIEARIAELEENVKRKDLDWKDQTRATGELTDLLKSQGRSQGEVALELNIHERYLRTVLTVYKNLDKPQLENASGIDQAYSILQNIADRRTAEIVEQIAQAGKIIFEEKKDNEEEHNESKQNGSETDIPNHSASGPLADSPSSDLVHNDFDRSRQPDKESNGASEQTILNVDFIAWAQDYSGPKFNLIHVDFPYGTDFKAFNIAGKTEARSEQSGSQYASDKQIYYRLLNAFTANLDRFCSYSAHVVFWFSMEFYEETKNQLQSAGLKVQNHPLIWHKTDGQGIMPGAQTRLYPRHIYETALLCSRGDRPLVRPSGDCYGAPHTAGRDGVVHYSHKPEPMLRHFLSMMIDETTDVLDPTCGSGAALRAAEDLGARKTLGLEINPDFARAANDATVRWRQLRRISKGN